MTTVPSVIDLTGKSLLVTGGHRLVRHRVHPHRPRAIPMSPAVNASSAGTSSSSPSSRAVAVRDTPACAWLIGDVRDRDRLRVAPPRRRRRPVRAAALKQRWWRCRSTTRSRPCRRRPCIERRERDLGPGGDRQRRAASDDRAQHRQGRQSGEPLRPTTKLCAAKIISRGRRVRRGERQATFASVRYGNVVGSRGKASSRSSSSRRGPAGS